MALNKVVHEDGEILNDELVFAIHLLITKLINLTKMKEEGEEKRRIR